MTLDEYIADLEARRNELLQRLETIMASDLPPRVKQARIHAVTHEATVLKEEVLAATRAAQNTQSQS